MCRECDGEYAASLKGFVSVIEWLNLHGKLRFFLWFCWTRYVFVAPWKLIVVVLEITAFSRSVACLILLYKGCAEGSEGVCWCYLSAGSGHHTGLHQRQGKSIQPGLTQLGARSRLFITFFFFSLSGPVLNLSAWLIKFIRNSEHKLCKSFWFLFTGKKNIYRCCRYR